MAIGELKIGNKSIPLLVIGAKCNQERITLEFWGEDDKKKAVEKGSVSFPKGMIVKLAQEIIKLDKKK